jgi:fatty acid desaturase
MKLDQVPRMSRAASILALIAYIILMGAVLFLWRDKPPIATFLILVTAAPVGLFLRHMTREPGSRVRPNRGGV